jgi:hypothetical protein
MSNIMERHFSQLVLMGFLPADVVRCILQKPLPKQEAVHRTLKEAFP